MLRFPFARPVPNTNQDPRFASKIPVDVPFPFASSSRVHPLRGIPGSPKSSTPRGSGRGAPGAKGAGRRARSGVGVRALALYTAPRGISRLQLQQLLPRREEGWRVARRAGAPAGREEGGAAGLCRRSRRGARRSPALLPGARMRTLKLALLG